MADENKSVVRRLLEEVWAAGTLDAAEELIEPVAYRSHVPDVSDARMSHWTGPNIVRVEVAAYRSAFPNLAVEVGALVAEGDAVAAYWTVGGTNTATLRVAPMDDVVDEEIEPTGKELSASASTLFRLAGGKITEAAFGWHPLGLLDQVRLYARGSQVLDLGGGNRVSVVIPPG